jgi:S-(hydroxymethyl)glutathione dehydrogenase/alcohol dehydrogenase
VKAARLHEVNSPLKIETVPDPTSLANEIVIAVRAAGICDTDVNLRHGGFPAELPLVLGHQIAGTVQELGSMVTKVKKDDRVLSNFTLSCWDCGPCHGGYENLCDRWQAPGISRPGGFAEFVSIPETAVEKISPSMPFEEASLLTCGFGTPYRAFKDAGVQPTETVLITGGILWGLTTIQMVHLVQATAILADREPKRLAQAQQFGADATIDISQRNLTAQVMGLTHGRGVDCVLDFTGDSEIIQDAMLATRKKGRVVVVGRAIQLVPMSVVLQKLIFEEVTLKGAFLAKQSDIKELIRLYDQKRISLASLVSHRLSLEEINRGFDLLERESATGVVIQPG